MSTGFTEIYLDPGNVEDYQMFLKVKALPSYRFIGRVARFPSEYAHLLGISKSIPKMADYEPIPSLFDYQRDMTKLAIYKRKFAIFARPGLGKTLCMLEFARYIQKVMGPSRRVLILSPLMVVRQTIAEAKRFYEPQGIDLQLEQVAAKHLPLWVQSTGSAIGITNYEALTDKVERGIIGALICDESSIMKSFTGKAAGHLIRIGSGLAWKLCLTGTPAPNDRVEFANHAVFLDQFPTTNSFLARYFINKGKTSERWEVKPHAIQSFYRDLSHWCIFLNNPKTYGWTDNTDTIPPINIHIHDVELTKEQKTLVGQELGTLFAGDLGGIVTRSKMSRLSKGKHNGKRIETNKPKFIRDLVDTWTKDESTLIWCRYNDEQDHLERIFPEAASIQGKTPYEKRAELIADFQSGKYKIMISKPEVLGLGLNLQVATRQVFSSCDDSYEDFVQAIMRSNRVGSTQELNVHLPVSDVERPMMENVLRKAKRVESDMAIQEELFSQNGLRSFDHD